MTYWCKLNVSKTRTKGTADDREAQFVAFSVATSRMATTNVNVWTVTEDTEPLDKPAPTGMGHGIAINVPIRTTSQTTIATNRTGMGIDAVVEANKVSRSTGLSKSADPGAATNSRDK